MQDNTIKVISSEFSPTGETGQKYLVSGKRVSMRVWEEEPAGELKSPSQRAYETVGYVLKGKAELHLDDYSVNNYTIEISSILYFQRKTTGAAFTSRMYWRRRSASSSLLATR